MKQRKQCPKCGKYWVNGRDGRKFCDDKCRYLYWQERHRVVDVELLLETGVSMDDPRIRKVRTGRIKKWNQ